MAQLLPSKVAPSVPWKARKAESDHTDPDYGQSDEPDWREVDWQAHLHRVQVGRDSVNYVDIGEDDGVPVVFVHGLGGQWQNWLENLPRIAQERRVLALDLPGFGCSPMPADEISMPAYGRLVDGFCEALGLDRVSLVGNSMGGLISGEVTIQNPDRVERLALVSAAGITSANVLEAPAKLVGRVAAGVTAYTAARHRTMAKRPLTRYFMLALVVRHPAKLRADAAWVGLISGAGRPAFEPALKGSVRYDYRDRLTEIKCPTLIVWGQKDTILSVDDAHEYEDLISDSRKTVMEDTGHVPMFERPRAVNDVLLEFLGEPGAAQDRKEADAVSELR